MRPSMQVCKIKQRWYANSICLDLSIQFTGFPTKTEWFAFNFGIHSSQVQEMFVSQLFSFICMVILQNSPTHVDASIISMWIQYGYGMGHWRTPLYLMGDTMVSCRFPFNQSSEWVKNFGQVSPHQRSDVHQTWPKFSESRPAKKSSYSSRPNIIKLKERRILEIWTWGNSGTPISNPYQTQF